MISALALKDSTWASTRSATSLAILTVLISSASASPLPARRRGGKFRTGGGSDDLSSPKFYLSYESDTIPTPAGHTIAGIWVPDGQTNGATSSCTFWSDGEPLAYQRPACASPKLQWWLWAAIALLAVFLLCLCVLGKSKKELEKEEQEDEEAQEAQEAGEVPAGDEGQGPAVVGSSQGKSAQVKVVS